MRDTTQIAKLAALRAKTDRDLAILIECELSRALALASLAEAARAGEKIAALLPIAGLSPARRAMLERRLEALHLRLDRLPPGEIPAGRVCSA
jgi:hypothetical protein